MAKNPILCIGISATMASGGAEKVRKGKVARFASRIFGLPVGIDQVVGETLVASLSGGGLKMRNASPSVQIGWSTSYFTGRGGKSSSVAGLQ